MGELKYVDCRCALLRKILADKRYICGSCEGRKVDELLAIHDRNEKHYVRLERLFIILLATLAVCFVVAMLVMGH